jgi:hypothetical protein
MLSTNATRRPVRPRRSLWVAGVCPGLGRSLPPGFQSSGPDGPSGPGPVALGLLGFPACQSRDEQLIASGVPKRVYRASWSHGSRFRLGDAAPQVGHGHRCQCRVDAVPLDDDVWVVKGACDPVDRGPGRQGSRPHYLWSRRMGLAPSQSGSAVVDNRSLASPVGARPGVGDEQAGGSSLRAKDSLVTFRLAECNSKMELSQGDERPLVG